MFEFCPLNFDEIDNFKYKLGDAQLLPCFIRLHYKKQELLKIMENNIFFPLRNDIDLFSIADSLIASFTMEDIFLKIRTKNK